ncbi:MAG: hypothetical protein AB2L09_01440 [Coriobacteriia bacterium]
MQRPVGVTLIGWLAVIAGILALIGGISLLVAGIALLAFSAGTGGGLAGVGAVLVLLLALWLLALGTADIIFGSGMLRLRGWAWMLGAVLASIGLLSNIAQLFAGDWFGATLGLIVNGIILYYLFTDEVKGAFGRRGVGPTTSPIFTPAATSGPHPPAPPAPTPPAPVYAPPTPEPPTPESQPPAPEPPTPEPTPPVPEPPQPAQPEPPADQPDRVG